MYSYTSHLVELSKSTTMFAGYMGYHPMVDETYAREHASKMSAIGLGHVKNPSVEFLREFKDRIAWYKLCENNSFSENVIDEFKEYVDWNNVLMNSKLSEGFVRENINRMDTFMVFTRQSGYSSDFVNEFATTESCIQAALSKHHLSDDFIEFNRCLIRKELFSNNRYLTIDQVRRFSEHIVMNNNIRSIIEDAHLVESMRSWSLQDKLTNVNSLVFAFL